MLIHTLTIVGVGLIGGSIGLAAKKRGLAQRVVGVGRDEGKLENARARGAIDDYKIDLSAAAPDADLIVFCTPVDRIADEVRQASAHCKPAAILTDAGSTKHAIVEAVESASPPGLLFVGAHPLAGSEKKGVKNAHADLFVERCTVLTPTAKTPPAAVKSVRSFWQELGARVQLMSPQEHDQALALTSHLPHLLAAALAGMLPNELHGLTATGFRDTTRVAAGDPDVWTPIFRHNRVAVLDALNLLEERLRFFRNLLANDYVPLLEKFLAQGKKVRDALGS
ncbi:MAG: prephenate dehydrogenase/arogenate dehydrogenase family protein [Gemmataceae bacterium]|nr:prephenate dehydrogenase/arogenate dehydrogenase family protein [Gemmataceae bacterium]